MIDLCDCRNFKKECPNGILDKGKVQKIYKQKLLPHSDSKFLVDQLFRIIDDDNNGGIDFKVSQAPRPDPVESMCLFSVSQEFLIVPGFYFLMAKSPKCPLYVIIVIQ